MRTRTIARAVWYVCVFAVTWAAAGDIDQVTMISLADRSRPWTLTVDSDGEVEWKGSSGGQLLDSLFGEPDDTARQARRIDAGEVARIFSMIDRAGYGQEMDHAEEPRILLVVTRADGTEIRNCGPNSLETDEALVAFREIERALVTAAGFQYEEEVETYKTNPMEERIFLLYGIVYEHK